MRTVVYSRELGAVVNTLRHMPEDESLDAQLAQFAALVGKAEYEGRTCKIPPCGRSSTACTPPRPRQPNCSTISF